jgi:hypothetical protein
LGKNEKCSIGDEEENKFLIKNHSKNRNRKQNIRIKKLRDDTGWVSQTQMPSRPKRAQELF